MTTLKVAQFTDSVTASVTGVYNNSNFRANILENGNLPLNAGGLTVSNNQNASIFYNGDTGTGLFRGRSSLVTANYMDSPTLSMIGASTGMIFPSSLGINALSSTPLSIWDTAGQSIMEPKQNLWLTQEEIYENSLRNNLFHDYAGTGVSQSSSALTSYETVASGTLDADFGYVYENSPSTNYLILQLQKIERKIADSLKRIKSVFKTTVDWIDQFTALAFLARIPKVLLA